MTLPDHFNAEQSYVYCLGVASYDERESLPNKVFATLEAAQAEAALPPGRGWSYDSRDETWTESPHDRWSARVIRRYAVVSCAINEEQT